MNQCLRNLSVLALLAAHTAHQIANAIRGYSNTGGQMMVVGGPSGLFPSDPFDLWMSGDYRKNVSMMGGVTKHDGSFALASNDLMRILRKFNAIWVLFQMLLIFWI